MFTHLDDESVFKQLDFTEFEETFKTKAQAGTVEVLHSMQLTFVCYRNYFTSVFMLGNQQEKESKKPEPAPRKKTQRESLLDPNRSQNVAIAKKKLSMPSEEIREAIAM